LESDAARQLLSSQVEPPADAPQSGPQLVEEPPMGPDLAIIYTPVGGGHKAAAMATAEAARARGLSVETIDLFELAPRVVGNAYLTAHFGGQTVAPRLYGSAYFESNHKGGTFEPVRRGFDHLVFAELVREVSAMRPRAIVATHHLPLIVLGRARRKMRLATPLVGVVTDYTAHAVWAEQGVDAFCVGCPLARHELVLHGVRPDLISMTGIPIRRAFGATPPAEDPRPGETLRVLVTSGGFGIGPIREIVCSFEGLPAIELTVVCGAAEGAVPRVQRAAAQAGVVARVLGFERDMPARVAEAHVVVGKAGGLTVSETMAAGRPMAIVGTVPGNETFNEELVVRGGAGYAARALDVGRVVQAMRSRGEIAAMGERARGLVVPDSADRVVDVALGLAGRRAARAA
jgi:processive 1,2-diacylglycerol beta-glucosyltransferase